ncbi:MAG: GAF and ANTAR domain-containing protein [Nocardioidaceae bacterium]|nr:GAF and ANTAR domain-containing protein [Nocardioidaceae bacterium]
MSTVASSSPSARRWDELQHTLQQGPCVDAVWADDTYLAKDLAHDPRWPQWSPRVAAQGAGSVLAIRLASPDETLGALNMYADRANAFTADDVDLALIYASHAADAMSTAKLLTGLRIAVKSRHHIGIAQGILMLRYDLSQEQAFDTLRRYSSQTNIKIRDLAELVIETRGLPDLEILERGDPTRDHDADLPDSSAQESTSTG